MATEKEIRQIEQFTYAAPAQPDSDLSVFRRENPVGSGKYETIKLKISDIMGGVTGNTALSETFAGASLTNGRYYLFGYYDAPLAHKAFTQAAATQTLGTSGGMYGAFAFVVVSGGGSTDAGVVKLRVSGTSVDDNGVRTTSDTEDLIPDITALPVVANAYFQTSKKWLGQVTFTLMTASGSPTTFNLTANYGFSVYENASGNGFTVDEFSARGHAEASDSTNDFDVILYKQPANGETTMTYSAAAFRPTGTEIFRLTDVVSTDNLLVAGDPFAFRRKNIATAVEAESGFLVEIVYGTSNSISYMNVKIGIK